MNFIKKLLFSIVIATSMGAVSSTAIAAGKIENATTADVKEAIDNTIENIQQAITSLQNGGDKDGTLELINNARQSSKRIESNRLDVKRNRAVARLKKAKFAIKRDQNDSALALLSEALTRYQEIKSLF